MKYYYLILLIIILLFNGCSSNGSNVTTQKEKVPLKFYYECFPSNDFMCLPIISGKDINSNVIKRIEMQCKRDESDGSCIFMYAREDMLNEIQYYAFFVSFSYHIIYAIDANTDEYIFRCPFDPYPE
jgi:hypothetical protein